MTNYDRINFVIFGTGEIWIDFVNQRCTHNGISISPLNYCVHYCEWLKLQCDQYNIQFETITSAEMKASIRVEISRSEAGIRGWLTSSMDITCSSEIVMDGIKYAGSQSEAQEMGLGQILNGTTY